MMGSGKSYWAYHLSKKLSLNYVDTDNLIEHKMQLTTSQIFEKFGESFFREKENLALQELIKNTSTPTIVATGGGLPCFFNNAQIMNQHGISFFLNTDVKIIAERVFKQLDKRPLLKNYSTLEDLEIFLQAKIQERLPFYNKANFILNQQQITESNFIQIITKYASNEL
jgi:shikimate kinase